MKSRTMWPLVVVSVILVASLAVGQDGREANIPAFVKYSGSLTDASGRPVAGTVEVTFSLYKEQQGGAALWMESQKVEADSAGNYTVALGLTTSQGLPPSLFVAGEARWLGVQIAGQAEQPRVMLLAVPYAMKAGDAATLGGLPPSAFMMTGPAATNTARSDGSINAQTVTAPSLPPATSSVTTTGGTVNAIPLFTTASNIQNSILSQTGTTGINVAGKLSLPATGPATAAAGKNSRPETLAASTYNSGTNAAVTQTFQLQAEATGNNTTSPSGTLNLLYGSGTNTPAETGFKINSKGLVTFPAGQTFPGTLTGITAGTDLTVSGTGHVTVNVDTTKVPQLTSNNTFTGMQRFANTGIGTAPSTTTYTPLSIGSANGFGTWFSIANTSAGGHTWNIISAGAGNAEGAGNFGITDLTGKSTIWLEGNTNTSNLLATGSAGASIIDADVQGANNTTPTPGLRFGGGSSGETIASNRNVGLNRFGLDFYTNFTPRVSITQGGQMGIATRIPRNQLDVISQSTGYYAIYAGGGSAGSGSGTNGGDGIYISGGDADPTSTTAQGGVGLWAYGGSAAGGSDYGAATGGIFHGGSGNGALYSGGDGIEVYAGSNTSQFGPFAAFFAGDILVNGGVYNGTMATVIDHPLDPSNKVLRHSAVASAEMMNIYDGIASLNDIGEATVIMPDWFSALNRDFRYQLTAIGAPGPNLYVAEELANNQFKIGGGRPGMKVSWQITGIRQDAWANSHRIQVEEEKNARERGFYLHPELFGAPEEKSVEWARHPETMRRIKQLRGRQAAGAKPTALATAASGN